MLSCDVIETRRIQQFQGEKKIKIKKQCQKVFMVDQTMKFYTFFLRKILHHFDGVEGGSKWSSLGKFRIFPVLDFCPPPHLPYIYVTLFPSLAAALGPLAYSSRSARPPLASKPYPTSDYLRLDTEYILPCAMQHNVHIFNTN